MSMHAGDHDPTVKNLPLTDPRCQSDSCLAFQAAHNLSQKLVSYNRQFEYGHWTAWYYAIIIFLFALWHGRHIYTSSPSRSQRRDGTIRPSGPGRARAKCAAAIRYLSYRRCRGPLFDRAGLPSVGTLALLTLSILFLLILTFAVRPYYREHRGYGSPPLGVRTGLMAAACTPLIVALSGKANFITMLTGIGHERLNTVHRWVSWMCFGLSVAHTIPFIVAPLKDGGPRQLHKQFYKPGGFEYTGVPPLAILFGIVLLSIPYIRHRFYESFYALHIAMYITYLGLCFWHFGKEGDSWTYLWATLAIYLASTLGRVFWYNRTYNVKYGQWISGSPILNLKELPDGMTQLDILAPLNFRWKPGQHCFVRLPGFDMFGNHPFTIASACQDQRITSTSEKLGSDYTSNAQVVTFYIRSHTGFTKKLSDVLIANLSQSPVSSSAWLEGPYGGLPYAIENMYDQVVLVAGGGGVTATMPWLEHITTKRSAGISMRSSKVVFVWVVRRAEHLSWAREKLQSLRDIVREKLGVQEDGFLEMKLFVTNHTDTYDQHSRSRSTTSENDITDVEKDGDRASPTLGPAVPGKDYTVGRPQMNDLIPSILDATPAPKTMILGCGPESLKIDLSNACAAIQTRILRAGNGVGIEEVALHTETFGW